jgi:alpha-L-glutamate ligase-like protein
MWWLFGAARRLREQGILGMNQRNAEYILDHNPRSRFALVDDKLALHEHCAQIGVPSPEVFGVVSRFGELAHIDEILAGREEFAIKPNRGAGGRGIVVVTGRVGQHFQRSGGTFCTREQLQEHLAGFLSGLYSLGGTADRVLIQQRVRLHPALAPISFQGIPDIRVILHREEPVMAMLRLPTRESGGRANLHQGGIGVGIDLETGMTHHAVAHNRVIEVHPDTEASVVGRQVPQWEEILEVSRRVAREVGLGYLGVDVVLDAQRGPLLLEANARPGLAIQIANRQGLNRRLEQLKTTRPAARGCAAAISVPAGRVAQDRRVGLLQGPRPRSPEARGS